MIPLSFVLWMSFFGMLVNLSCVVGIYKWGSRIGRPLRILLFVVVILTSAPALAWLELLPSGGAIGGLAMLGWICYVWYKVMKPFAKQKEYASGISLKL